MTSPHKNRRLFLIYLFFFLSGSFAQAQNWDVNLLNSINPPNPNSGYWRGTSGSAYWVPAAVFSGQLIAGIASDNEAQKHRAYQTLLSIGVGQLVSTGIKYTVNRQRPASRHPGEIFANSSTSGPSFPSGHTVLAFSTATALAIEYKKWYITAPAFVWAGTVGYSRMYLGKHYPTDVLAGIGVGAGSAVASNWLNKNLYRSYYQHRQEQENIRNQQ